MIIVRLKGGLGNQMFQYAFGRALAIRHGTTLRFDLQDIVADEARAYGLPVWRIVGRPANPIEKLRLRVLDQMSRRMRPGAPYYLHPVIEERVFSFDRNLLQAKRDCYLTGFWQSENYFEDVAEQIRTDFVPRREIAALTRNIERDILAAGNRSVFLHVRRTDYVHHLPNLLAHGSCSTEYYLRAAEYIASKVPNPQFFVFSDEPEWVRGNLHLPYHVTIIEHNKAGDGLHVGSEHEDLWLMSRCRHAVLANSSFSWWGAWLNRERERIVIAPRRWVAALKIDTRDLIPARWIRLD